MIYRQEVHLNGVSLRQAKKAFNNISFLRHLIMLQPVKVIKWDGTFNGATAHMRFWFFGWRDFKVKHSENLENDESFSFKDIGVVLPFGLSKWEHTHKVIYSNNSLKIIDDISFSRPGKLILILIFPILIFPIFIRRILYRTYSWDI